MIQIVDIPLRQLKPNPDNPRTDVGDVSELAASIRAQGLKQELLVTPAGDGEHGEPVYRIVIGHRRFAAAQLAGLEYLPCRVEEMTAREEREVMLVENTQRADLTPIEEADGYQGLLDLGADVGELAGKTGRSESFVRRRLKIAGIPKELRGKSEGFAQLSLADLDAIAEFGDDPEAQEELIKAAGSHNFGYLVQKLTTDRDNRRWYEQAYAYCKGRGIKIIDLGNQSAWDLKPDGYQWPDVFLRNRPFIEQYEERIEGAQGEPWLARCTYGLYLSLPKTPEQLEQEDKDNEEREQRRAQRSEAEERRDRFAADSLELRSAWMRKHLTSLKAIPLRAACARLAFQSLTDGSGLHAVSFYGTESRDLWQAYNMLAPTPLPDKPEETGDEYWTAEVLRRGEQPGALFRELLVFLCAHLEARIEWDEPAGVAVADEYYGVLESLGYPVSDAERTAVDGGFLPEKQDEQ
ncbi:ParB/RepB/Spo0J family partition protein [Bifidobacterium tibiigranuli]|jgi:ParB family chromosome partitioning protein|uniref:ParB/RepB/Spo0J family partition protein n=1 Tax=Bifidobacterium tibiigranuli TaxID=2172043 RepID=UPI00235509DB|nr:ParB/RepB/Spo0J family partition protein [Bifidobacterium tibiigranuli]MCI1211036.1 ParB/RepB/Spo0J family partition protein [Bifidobacterium tibiigranuli]MCI1221801.1 ParB/RepB/Spo0J family partition protein [Bifidobacterium tibiigranuli]